ncbi:MAG: NosD domain-containing protein [Flavobacteriales bacterium]
MRAFLHRALAIALAIAGFSLWSTVETKAQKPAWIIGDHVIDFRQASSGTISDFPLPQPTDVAAPLRYDGQVASKSQYVQLDDRGEVLFFLIDGAIYDRKGYLIADNDPTGIPDPDNCSECVPIGSSEVAVIQVPGDCSKFYIFTTHYVTSITAPWTLYVSVLDLAAQNPYFTGDLGKKGVLMDETMLDNAGIDLISTYYPIGGDRQVLWVLNDPNYPIDYLPEHTYSGCNGALHMEAVDGSDTEEKFFLVTTGAHIARWRVLDTGLEYLGSDATTCSLGDVPDNSECQRTAKGDLEVWRSGDNLKVAQTAYDYDPIADMFYYRIVHHAYTWSGSDLVLTASDETVVLDTDDLPYDGNANLITQPGIGGLEFSPNGDWLYFTLSHPGPIGQQFGFVVMSDYSVGFYPVDFYDFVDTEIEINASDVTGSAIYLCGYDPVAQTHRLGRWTWPDNGYASPSTYWQDDVYTLPGITNLNAQLPGDEVYHLEMNQTANDQSDQRLASGGCCEAVFAMTSESDYTATTGSQTWTAAFNPFGTDEIVRFAGELVIPDGATVTIEDMTFEFGPDAAVIIEPGGYLYNNGSTFTSACSGRWRGVEVQGNSSLPQLPYSNQGRFRLLNAVVENAEVGALAATRTSGGGLDPAGYRGVVQATNTTWRNNVVDAQIIIAPSISPTPPYNASRFYYCDFVTNEDWPDAFVPYAHAWLRGCGVVVFDHCKFRNTNSSFVGADRGFGIFSSGSAGPRVIGNNAPLVSYMEGLWCGVAIGRHRGYWVKGMNLRDNTYGIVDLGPTMGEVTDNVFDIPEWDELGPSPVGLMLYQTNSYVVENNIFESTAINANAGVVFWGPMETTNRIYNNTFQDLSLGTFVIGDHQDEQNANVTGLEILCGDYTDNRVDYGMGPGAYIGGSQGEQFNALNLAGNRFFSDPDCSTSFDMAFGPGIPSNSFFTYNRHTDSDCDVICEDPAHMTDVEASPDAFDKPLHCADSFSEEEEIDIDVVSAMRKSKKAALLSSLAQYREIVDHGATPSVLNSIAQSSSSMPSYSLRDILVEHHPLSDTALEAVVDRTDPMESWHVAQVFVQNAPVRRNIVNRLPSSGLVSTYQMSLIDYAQENGPTGMKDLLEAEIHEESRDHYAAYTNCLRYWSNDTLEATAGDSLRALLLDGVGTGGRFVRIEQYVEAGDYASAQDSLDTLVTYSTRRTDYAELRNYVNLMEATHNGDSASVYELEVLAQLATEGNPGAGLAWDVLLTRDHWRALPQFEMPNEWKSYTQLPDPRNSIALEPVLQVQPNPTSARLWITFGTQVQADRVHVHNAQGQLVWHQTLADRTGIVELNVKDWSNGLYLATLLFEGMPVGETKFTVAGSEQR